MTDGLGEFEYELEFENEGESENEFEGEGFGFGSVGQWLGGKRRAFASPGDPLRNAAGAAARAATSLFGDALSSNIDSYLPARDHEGEFEFEGEGEFEGAGEYEFFVNPVGRVYPDALMEHMGLAAMEAENEYEAAEHFAPLIPVVASKLLPVAARAASRAVAKTLPHVAKVISRATPQLTRGVTHLARIIHRDPQTRPLVRVIPSVARRTVTRIARQAAAGQPVSPRHAVRILAHENHRVLSNPKRLHAVLHRAHRMDQHAHRVTGLPIHTGHLQHLYGALPLHLRHLHPRHPQVLAWHARPRVFAPGVASPALAGGSVVGVPPRFASVAPKIAASRLISGGVTANGICPSCGRPAARACCCC